MKSFGKRLTLFALKMILKLHSFSYSRAGRLAQKVEKDGLHPKHRIMNYHKFFVDTLEGFKEELDKTGLSVLDYSIQFGEIWVVIGGYNTIEEVE